MLSDRWPVVLMRPPLDESNVTFVCLLSRSRSEGAIAPAQVVAFDVLTMEPIGYFTWNVAGDGEALHVEVVPHLEVDEPAKRPRPRRALSPPRSLRQTATGRPETV